MRPKFIIYRLRQEIDSLWKHRTVTEHNEQEEYTRPLLWKPRKEKPTARDHPQPQYKNGNFPIMGPMMYYLKRGLVHMNEHFPSYLVKANNRQQRNTY